ncbi:MAG: hypothetical protein ACLS34_02930 [Faecalibacterium sp.]
MAVCNEVLRMKENRSHCDSYQEHCLKDEVLSREEIVHRIQLSPFYMVMTRLCRREVFEKIRFPEGKNYEDAFTAPEIIGHG